jgi:hypothetical protein
MRSNSTAESFVTAAGDGAIGGVECVRATGGNLPGSGSLEVEAQTKTRANRTSRLVIGHLTISSSAAKRKERERLTMSPLQ